MKPGSGDHAAIDWTWTCGPPEIHCSSPNPFGLHSLRCSEWLSASPVSQSTRDSLTDSILILLVLLKAITRVLSKDESISHLHLSWKCLILRWLLASIYKEGQRLGKLLGLSFNGYSQPALCHYWPTLSWASSQICDIIRPFSALLHTLDAPSTLHQWIICSFQQDRLPGGLTLDSRIPLFSSPAQIRA